MTFSIEEISGHKFLVFHWFITEIDIFCQKLVRNVWWFVEFPIQKSTSVVDAGPYSVDRPFLKIGPQIAPFNGPYLWSCLESLVIVSTL